MIASTRRRPPSSTLAASRPFRGPTLGSISSTEASGPELADLAELVAEVFQGELLARPCAGPAARSRPSRGPARPSRSATGRRPCRSSARPCARGWKSSRSSAFSPMPTKRIGTLATVRIDSAAPPRESPSSLVRMAPVSGRAAENCSALLTASWPVIESATKRVSCGWIRSASRRISSISAVSTWRRPAVSMITTSWPRCRATAEGPGCPGRSRSRPARARARGRRLPCPPA